MYENTLNPNCVYCVHTCHDNRRHTHLGSEDEVLGGICSLGRGSHNEIKHTTLVHRVHSLHTHTCKVYEEAIFNIHYI